ncbi:hypothetical protein GCM10010521_54220 [Streptomyces rameus]|uniref:Uncharacterized protein n=1 Tax=Streptomyces rameus TaxID=68261 RepID=A0ABN3V1X6_9ACTN
MLPAKGRETAEADVRTGVSRFLPVTPCESHLPGLPQGIGDRRYGRPPPRHGYGDRQHRFSLTGVEVADFSGAPATASGQHAERDRDGQSRPTRPYEFLP